MYSPITRLPLALILILLSFTTAAENSTRNGGYTIHHNAIPTATLSPEIASQYQIVRSKYRGMINISVIQEVPGTTGRPVSAKVSAYSMNLIGRRHDIQLREIREGEAIYYIGDFPIVDGEELKFNLEVTPEGSSITTRTSISQTFYID